MISRKIIHSVTMMVIAGLLLVSGSFSISYWHVRPVQAAPLADDTSQYTERFLTLYKKLKDPANGYFSPQGIPYHSVETLIVEAPDYGHETTSEAFSFWIWLEAVYGRVTGDWQPFNNAWATMEKYIIPSTQDQPTNGGYNASSPAQYGPESPEISDYPVQLDSQVSVGQDPIGNELKQTYGNADVYGMAWLLDVDNWYGYGRCGDGKTTPSYVNSYQRGASESVWETVVHPSCETFTWGGNDGHGFLSLFNKPASGGSYAQQWRYTDAPDADARAIQAAYWAYTWANSQGKGSAVASTIAKAAKMGDFLRYATYDKYFKTLGCQSVSCPAGSGKNSSTYLLGWYYAWGGSLPSAGNWAWRIGSSTAHQGYQNPLAAWALSNVQALKPLSPTAATDWSTSLKRQLEFYRWLQSSEGAIAGGASNSWDGHYATPPAGTPTFYGMAYDWQPVYHDPPSNNWFGFQAWSLERVAEYYYVTGDAQAKAILDKWVAWVKSVTKLNADGSYAIPSTLKWTGQPDTWNAANPGQNANLHVSVVDTTSDVGVTAALARTLLFYAAKANDTASRTLAQQLLDRMWTSYADPKGVSNPEVRADYNRFDDPVYIPSGWTGKNAQGATLDSSLTFISQRPHYKQDPDWPKVQAYLDGGAAPTFTYHRFWAQADIAMAMADVALLFGDNTTPTPTNTPTTTPTTTPTSTVTPSPTTTVTPTPTTPPSAVCKVNYSVSNQWPGGFTASITITNTGKTAINGWTLEFSFPGDQKVQQGWNAKFSQSGKEVTVTNESYNGSIAPGASVNPGFNGSWSGTNTPPTSFTLNGSPCSTS
ncbi:cellulase/cellobiase CelA1 [Thermosporothrix hazakensis]|jgi:hypothetical protein|uniref:Cellulase/cellobiase CelA1 n=1 Tax=Thermosporothrix hazakensis TaxID=644383 RepID=A0A326UAD4_THEHA|nr:glycoside hydrolase family 48 protein [Thermosporothrix hazakensis]PZW32772.1 cellulase/cellobiase CelA1 [Thermosporothrix hazakensis]GCE50128.1 hypothetical protein KTH_49970 [Thermosporothrix hazakensis]